MSAGPKTIISLASLSREELEKKVIELQSKLDAAEMMNNWYLEQYKAMLQKKYGQSSEAGYAGQLSFDDLNLINEAEAFVKQPDTEPDTEELLKGEQAAIVYKKNKKRKQTACLPVVTDTFELTSQEQVCPKCGAALHKVKDEVRVEIEVIPAQTRVHKYVSAVYSCRNCSAEGKGIFVTASGAPKALIRNSVASPSLVADIITKKYVDATPFYRQEKNCTNYSIPITRNNMCNWSMDVAEDYFTVLVNRMKKILYADGVIHCDETFTEVLHEKDRTASAKSYVWVTTSSKYRDDHPMAIYNYRPGRSQADAREVLKGYKGYIMCDGYKVYDTLPLKGRHGEEPMDVKPVACLVHVRRKFADALKLVKPEDRAGTGAALAVAKLQRIFETDNKLKDMPVKDRQRERQGELKLLLDDFFAWAKGECDVSLPKTHYGLALNYALEQKDKVMRVLEDGRLELENNRAERAVKPFVIGRKNWLFSNTPAGADASCTLYGVVETAKLNGLIPFEYLKYVMETIRGRKITEELIDGLLPWSENIPEYVKVPADNL